MPLPPDDQDRSGGQQGGGEGGQGRYRLEAR